MIPRTISPSHRHLGHSAAALVLAAVIVAAASLGGRAFIWNLSPSLPRGMYRVAHAATPRRSSIVAFPPPAAVATMIATRAYLPPGVSLLKRVVALAGDIVCIDHFTFSVNGQLIATVRRSDSAGRQLDPFPFCGETPRGYAFVATPYPLGFDSRYFGPVPLSSLTVVVPAWTY